MLVFLKLGSHRQLVAGLFYILNLLIGLIGLKVRVFIAHVGLLVLDHGVSTVISSVALAIFIFSTLR